MSTLEIPYEYGEGAFDLKEILALMKPFAADADWYLVEFEPSSLVGPGGNTDCPPPEWVLALRREMEGGGPTVKLEWQTLEALSVCVGQTENALLVAVHPGQPLPLEPLDLNSAEFEVVLQSVDSTVWAITSTKRQLLEFLLGKFSDAKLVDKTSRYY